MNSTGRLPRLAALVCTAWVTVACSGGGIGAEPSTPAPSPTSVTAVDAAHYVRDVDGAYLCVLRRPDDLAALRASFSP